MARDCSKNTANTLEAGVAFTSSACHGAAAISIHAVVEADSFDTAANNNVIFHSNITTDSAGIHLTVHNGTSAVLRLRGRSQTSDAAQVQVGTTVLSTGVTYGVGGYLDIAGDYIQLYVNGAAEGGGAVTFGAATYTHGVGTGNDAIGGWGGLTDTTQQHWDGRISELAVWNVKLTADEFVALGSCRVSPLMIKPDKLIRYVPLIGSHSPEIDIVSGDNFTIAGSVPAAVHPRVAYMRRRAYVFHPVAVAGGDGSGGPLSYCNPFYPYSPMDNRA